MLTTRGASSQREYLILLRKGAYSEVSDSRGLGVERPWNDLMPLQRAQHQNCTLKNTLLSKKNTHL